MDFSHVVIGAETNIRPTEHETSRGLRTSAITFARVSNTVRSAALAISVSPAGNGRRQEAAFKKTVCRLAAR